MRSVSEQWRFIQKVIFSSSFCFILKIVVINMVAGIYAFILTLGITIDTFGSLKDSMMETEKNLREFCFICSIEKEKLDKNAPHGYFSHIVVHINH